MKFLSGSPERYWGWWKISYCHWCHFSGISCYILYLL